MESASSPQPFRAFSDDERKIIDGFSEEALTVINRELSPLIVGDVLQRLMDNMTTDMKLVTGFHPPALKFSDDTSSVPSMTFEMPLCPTSPELSVSGAILDNDRRVGGDRTGLLGQAKACLADYLPLTCRIIQTRYGLQDNHLLNVLRDDLLRSGINQDFTETDDGTLIVEGKPHSGNDRNAILWSALACVIGPAPLRRLSQHKSFDLESVLDACFRIFLRSEEARSRLLILLSQQKVLFHGELADSITRQGSRTLLSMERMTLRDQYQSWFESLEITGRRVERDPPSEDLQAGVPQLRLDPSVDGSEYLNDPFPIGSFPSFLAHLEESDREMWHKAALFLEDNPPQQREKILTNLDPVNNRRTMEQLRELCQWDALAAHERSILAKIYEEVVRFPYGIPDVDIDAAQRKGDLAGTPSYAVTQRRLNCFTSQWLITALAVECGIPYASIAYCHANHYGKVQSSAHGQLLFSLSDGTFVIVDNSLGKCIQSFPLSVIQHQREREHLKNFFKSRSQLPVKGMYEAFHLHIDQDQAEKMSLCSDLLVTTPDQAFTGGSLLNVGIGFEREGKSEEAFCAYELGLSVEPEHPDLLCRVGMYWFNKDDFDQAERYFRAALTSNIHHSHARYYFALTLWEQDRLPEASKIFLSLFFDKRKVWGDPDFQSRVDEAICALLSAAEDRFDIACLDAQIQPAKHDSCREFLTDDEKHLL